MRRFWGKLVCHTSLLKSGGRAIVGSSGILVVKTLFLKPTAIKNFIVIDGAINDLMRPGLYGSYHEILPVYKRLGEKKLFGP